MGVSVISSMVANSFNCCTLTNMSDSRIRENFCFQEALKHPLATYEDAMNADATTMSQELVKVLIDHKRGRTRQAHKRYVMVLRNAGFDPTVPLLDQRRALREEHAELFPLELLFAMSHVEGPPIPRIEDYIDVLDLLGPDDRVLHGAIYNTLSPIALRRGQHAAARHFAVLSIKEYEAGNAPYLMGFAHFHIAMIDIADGNLAAAKASIAKAEGCFRCLSQTDSELAQCQMAAAWIDLEHDNIAPDVAWLNAVKTSMLMGELWAEPFLMLAAVLFRTLSRSGYDGVLEMHAELETAMRVRRMTSLLPAMQLLRDELLSVGGTPLDTTKTALLRPFHLLLLQPTVLSLDLNGSENTAQDLPRLAVLANLRQGYHALQRRQFAEAAKHMWLALQAMADHGYHGLIAQELHKIDLFLAECRTRRRFVERARQFRNSVLPRARQQHIIRAIPQELTQSEYAVLLMLPEATSNKAMARDLDVSEPTVKFHLRNIYRKLDVHKRREAIEAAHRNGWITLPGEAVQSGT